ncbi:dihydroxyacetone kinase phosphoryl donor subunit DhaM [Salinibacterium sp. SWN1162]|uniref:dihydroxyacetone kinase phosphoryl donor subunit DhaM n=1 Tax=Salinibacterium sp. SWN1162 TaxID=2792053 RepID=UPI0018CFCB1D|nr:dihydroxyacetone kinase phosphoryl donor subunit DhaM [Salinibacterium sp. SWN1162]MBH0008541.1 HPr family phosphocarrier protein [Salinibacterium sp. SWN1162]
MIGIVVVSHSPALARAAVDLALEMVGETPPPIAIAAGAGDGIIGTDAVKVAEAIDEVASGEGVLVFMDLGSAVLSGTMATEFMTTTDEVRLTDAPFVEGLIAAIVLANAGASLDEVDREARAAMGPKQSQLADQGGAAPAAESNPNAAEAVAAADSAAAAPAAPAAPEATTAGPAEITTDATLVNPDGLHARPASLIVQALAGVDATLTIADVTAGKGPVSAKSLIGIMSLGAAKDHVLRFTATGDAAQQAIDTLVTMTADGFGELAN